MIIHLLLISLLLMSYQDLKDMEIDLILLLIFLALALGGIQYLSMIFSFIILNILYFYKKGIAYADILIISGCSNFISIENIGKFFILIGLGSMIYAFFFKKDKLPLIPFIFQAFLLINFKQIFLSNLPI